MTKFKSWLAFGKFRAIAKTVFDVFELRDLTNPRPIPREVPVMTYDGILEK